MVARLLSSMMYLRLGVVLRRPWLSGAGCCATCTNSRLFRGGAISQGESHWQRTDNMDQYEKDLDKDDNEMLEALLREELRRQKSIRFHKVRRQMTSPGPPLRTLTWEAIQQIRYLKQEFPEEWTLDRLAKGFSVSRSVIARVLQSTFVPSAERCKQQDARVAASQGQGVLTPALQSGRDHIRLPPGVKALQGPGKGGNSLASMTVNPIAVVPRCPEGIANCTTVPTSQQHPLPRPESAALGAQQDKEDDDNDKEDCWDGTVLSDQQLEELAERHQTLAQQDSAIIRKGREVFDSSGNFLYRI